jgi:hypothetical protein
MCPGNEESAGKRQRRRITPGNRWLKRTLAQGAWAASHVKNSYLAAQYRRLASRRGKKRALIAVAHSMLVIVYHMLKAGTDYADLRGDSSIISNLSASPATTSHASNAWATKSLSNPVRLPREQIFGADIGHAPGGYKPRGRQCPGRYSRWPVLGDR